MRNAKTRLVLDYWTHLRGARRLPARRDVDPRGLRSVLPFVFLADAPSADATPIRLAGTGLCERYGRELRGHNLQALWRPGDRPAVRDVIAHVLATPAPALARFHAETIERIEVAGELLLLPLSDESGAVTKLMGCAFATESTARLGSRPLISQRLDGVDYDMTQWRGDPSPAAPAVAPATEIRRKGHLALVVSQDHPDAMAS